MGKLSDILANGGYGDDDFRNAWKTTDAADEFAPLPPGEYTCHADSGGLETSRNATPGYKLVFKVLDGEHAGRKVWHDLWLTPAALPMAKRDLAKLGIEDPAKLELPLPPGIRCKVRVALRRDDDGNERNRVVRFDVIGIDKPKRDAFAPSDEAPEGGGVSAVCQDGRTTDRLGDTPNETGVA